MSRQRSEMGSKSGAVVVSATVMSGAEGGAASPIVAALSGAALEVSGVDWADTGARAAASKMIDAHTRTRQA
jgi:hypothetical protein